MEVQPRQAAIMVLISIVMITATVIVTTQYYSVGMASDTGSMEPTISGGEVVVIDQDVRASNIQVGDIIIFEVDCQDSRFVNSNYLGHRVVGVTSDGFITKGDANDHRDQSFDCIDEVEGEEIVGEIVVSL